MSTAITFKYARQVAKYVLLAKHPLMFRGQHGVGKSELVYQLADELNMPVTERRASQMTEGDLIGLPTIDGDSTAWNPPDWFKQCCNEGRLLFLDELDRACVEVRQGIFELGDSRKLNGHKLHPDTLIVAAVNGGIHAAEYQVGEMDPAELDRWTVFDVAPSKEDWFTWAKENGVHHIMLTFLQQNSNHLEHTLGGSNKNGTFEPNKKYPSRRSWTRFNAALNAGNLYAEKENHNIVRQLGFGYVGMEAAISFADFFRDMNRQVDPKDIINKGKIKLTADYGVIEHTQLIDKMDNQGYFKKKLSDNQIQNLVDYFVTLPSEPFMKMVQHISSSAIDSNIAGLLHGVARDGTDANARVLEVVNGQQEENNS